MERHKGLRLMENQGTGQGVSPRVWGEGKRETSGARVGIRGKDEVLPEVWN